MTALVTDLLVPEYRLMLGVTVGDVSDAAFQRHVVVVRPSCRLEPVGVVVHAATFQLQAHTHVAHL